MDRFLRQGKRDEGYALYGEKACNNGHTRTLVEIKLDETMIEDPTIALYESINAITGQMLAAARNSDWDNLCTLEVDCASMVGKLQGLESAASSENDSQLTGAIGLQKRTLIEKKLTADREIRLLTESRMTQLSSLLNRPRVERQLSMAYGGHQTPYN